MLPFFLHPVSFSHHHDTIAAASLILHLFPYNLLSSPIFILHLPFPPSHLPPQSHDADTAQ